MCAQLPRLSCNKQCSYMHLKRFPELDIYPHVVWYGILPLHVSDATNDAGPSCYRLHNYTCPLFFRCARIEFTLKMTSGTLNPDIDLLGWDHSGGAAVVGGLGGFLLLAVCVAARTS